MNPDYTFWLGEDAEYCTGLEIDPARFGVVIDTSTEWLQAEE